MGATKRMQQAVASGEDGSMVLARTMSEPGTTFARRTRLPQIAENNRDAEASPEEACASGQSAVTLGYVLGHTENRGIHDMELSRNDRKVVCGVI